MKITLILALLLVPLLGCSAGRTTTPVVSPIPPIETKEETGALPSPSVPGETTLVPDPTARPSGETAPSGVILGIYPSGFLQQRVDELIKFDHWIQPTGKRITIAATFMDFEEGNSETFVPAELDAAWDRGYVPFVNLSVGNLAEPRTSEHIAEGTLDKSIRSWARAYAAWSSTDGKRAFIAPLQEMNG